MAKRKRAIAESNNIMTCSRKIMMMIHKYKVDYIYRTKLQTFYMILSACVLSFAYKRLQQ